MRESAAPPAAPEALPPLAVIVPAAGAGSRLGGRERKAFVALAGQPLLLATCRALHACAPEAELILAVHPEDRERVEGEWWPALARAGAAITVAGGACRAESVWNALQAMPASAEYVVVHDAARPFVTPSLFRAVAAAAVRRGAAIPVLPLADAVKRIEGDLVIDTPPRTGLMRVQTPQAFRSDLLIDAFEFALRTGGLSSAIVDDSLLVERFGAPVAAVYGSEDNFKITAPEDMRRAEALCAAAGRKGGAP